MTQQGQSKSSKDGAIVEIPDSPPRRMDISQLYSPDKDALRAEVTSLREKLQFISAQSQNTLLSQNVEFRRVAAQYEEQARDINAAELAQQSAELTATFGSRMHQIESNIHAEANNALQTQHQTLGAEAELYIQQQQQQMIMVEQEEVKAYRAQVETLENAASYSYHKLHSDATEVVQTQQANLSTLWSELNEARHANSKHEEDKKQSQKALIVLQNENKALRDNVGHLRQVDKDATDAAREKADLVRQMEGLQAAMQNLQIKNKELKDQLTDGYTEQQDEDMDEDDYDADGEDDAAGEPLLQPPPQPHPEPRPALAQAQTTTDSSTVVYPLAHAVQHKEASSIVIDSLPRANTLKGWKMGVNRAVMAASGQPQPALAWITKAATSETLEGLEDDEGFDTLSVKLATSLLSLMKGALKQHIELKEEELMKEGKMLNGR